MKVVYAVTGCEDYMGFNEPDISFEDVDGAYAYMTSQPKKIGNSWEISPVLVFETMGEYCTLTKEDWRKILDEHEEIIRQRYKDGKIYENL